MIFYYKIKTKGIYVMDRELEYQKGKKYNFMSTIEIV